MATSTVTVLCPNARRVTVKTTPNTSVLQILEEACAKQKYNPDQYTLKHFRRTLDMTSTVRFSSLPNRCVLEMVTLAEPRTPQPVTLCLIDQQGNKYVQEYTPSATLLNVLEGSSICSSESLQDPTLEHSLVFSMNRIAGLDALNRTTLKQLGLTRGKGSMRYMCQKLNDNLPPPADAGVQTNRPAMPPDIQVVSVPNIDLAPQGAALHVELPSPPTIEHQAPVMPEVIPIAMPEVIPVISQPEIIPVEDMPYVCPQDVDVVVPAPVQLLDIGIPSRNVDFHQVPEGQIEEAAVPIADPAPESIMSPDVVSSSQSGVPDVVRRPEDSAQPPDVLNNERCEAQQISAFTGTAYSLSSSSQSHNLEECNSAAASAMETSSPLTVELPSQLMEVDSTQDTAVISLRSRRCVVFKCDETPAAQFQQESDDFFNLTAEDVRKLHREQMQKLKEMEDAPLKTQGLREADEQARILSALNRFPVTQLRIHFPGDITVQACFRPADTIQDVAVFVTTLLQNEALEFDLLTNYPRQPLPLHSSLNSAGLVPRGRLHFSSATPSGQANESLLKASVLSTMTSYQDANRALVSSRAGRSGIIEQSISAGVAGARDDGGQSSNGGAIPRRTENSSAVKKPKWFKLGK